MKPVQKSTSRGAETRTDKALVNAERAHWLRQMREAREKLNELEKDSVGGRLREPQGENESLYRMLAENSTDLISRHTADGVYIYASPASKTLLGYEPEELVGSSAYDFFHPDDLKEIKESHSFVLDEQGAYTVSYRIRRKDGTYTWFETTSRILEKGFNDSVKEGSEIIAVSRDITDRLQFEAGMKEAEHRYRTLVEQVPAVIYTSKDTENPGCTDYVSPQIEALLGYSPEDFIENPELWRKTLHPEDFDRVLAEIARAVETGEPFDAEYRMVSREGKEVWVQDEAVLVEDGSGRPRFWQGVKLDVSHQKQSEKQLQETGERIKAILESTTDAFFALDLQQRFVFVNRRAAQALRQTREELLGTNVENAFPRARGSKFYEECHEAVVSRKETHFEEFYRPLGKWFEVHAYPHDEGLSVYFRDITERKEWERQLREAEERFRSAFDNTPVGMALVSLEGHYLQVNRAICEILGYPEQELLNLTYKELTYPEDYEISMIEVERLNRGEQEDYTLEKRYIHAGGYPVWVSLSVSFVKDAEGKPLYYIAQIQNIEERKQAEAALREDAERLAAIISTQRAIVEAETDQESVLKLIVERSLELTNAAGATIEMMEGEELVYHTASGMARGHVGLRLGLSSSISGECVKKGEILLSEDTAQDPRVDRTATQKTGARSLIVVPLYHLQEIVGVLKVFSEKPHDFGSRDVDTLQLMAGLIAAAMSHTAEFEAKQALLDERTASLAIIQESEERFRTIFEGTTAGIAIVGLDGRVLQINPALQKLLGYSEEEIRDAHFTDVTHPEDLDKDLKLYKELAKGKRDSYQIEKRYIRKDGSLLWGLLNASPIQTPEGDAKFIVGMVEDITARKQAEQELRSRAQQQAMVARLGQRALTDASLRPLIDEATTLVAETLGTEYSKFLDLSPDGDSFVLLAGSGWDKGYVGKAWTSSEKSSQAGYSMLFSETVISEDLDSEKRFSPSHLQRAHGIKSGMTVVVHGPDRPFGVLGVDTTARRKFTKDDANFLQAVANVLAGAIGRRHAEDALRKSEREYRRLFELANDAILIYEPESREILDVNENACKIYGYPRETFVGMTMKELSLDRERGRLYLDTLLSRSSYQDFETIHRSYSGKPIDVLVNSSVIEFRGRRAVLSINRDITARKRTEASLMEIREAERRRIARDLHDVVLQDLSGTLQGLQALEVESNGNGNPVTLQSEIDALRRAVSGLRSAIYDLRQEKEEPFVRAVESLVELNRQMTPERQITLSVSESFTTEPGKNTGVELLRVLQEALANTRHHSDARTVKVSLCQQKGKILAEVYDDGRGFSPDESQSAGVGLSGMRERVEELGGELEITSRMGKGTLVKVSIPCREEAG